jgi:hypothetical protein
MFGMMPGCLIIRRTTTLPAPPYVGGKPLSAQIIHTPEGDMIASIPEGWILLNTQNKTGENTSLVLVDTLYSAIIFFERLPLTTPLPQDNPLEFAARASFERTKAKTRDVATLSSSYQLFGVDNREFCSYEYSADHHKTENRVAVFNTGKHVYMCVASQLSTEDKPMMRFSDLCSVQQTLLDSVKW